MIWQCLSSDCADIQRDLNKWNTVNRAVLYQIMSDLLISLLSSSNSGSFASLLLMSLDVQIK